MTLFDPESQTKIKTFIQTRSIKTRIQRISTGHAEDHSFALMADALSTLIPDLTIEEEKTDAGLPGFRLKDNITYSALPLDKELEPFLEALAGLSGHPQPLSGAVTKTLDRIDIPVQLTLYIALQCPFCPAVVRTVSALALHCPQIRLHIIDGSLFPETAAKDRVMSAPCLILDDGFRWTGQVTAHEILNMALHRDPAQLSAGSLQIILEQGDASWISRQLIEKDQLFDGFIALLLHDTWSVRLGAMVIVEDLCESAPELAARLCPILMERFDGNDIPVKGDILYVLGLAGDEDAGEWIRTRLASLDHRDLADAAQDALETLALKKT